MSHRGHRASIAGTSTAEPRDWRTRAACREYPEPEIFFPVSKSKKAAEDALEICHDCPVRETCLADELEHGGMQWGVRGGKTENERRTMLRQATEPGPAYTCTMCGAGLPGRPRKGGWEQRYCSDPCRAASKKQRQAQYAERKRAVAA